MRTVVLIGTQDTKGAEYAYVAARIRELGAGVILVDTGIHEPSGDAPTISRHEVAAAANARILDLAEANDRSKAVATMAQGAAEILRSLNNRGLIDAVLALGGGGGTSIASHAMKALPLGIPKIILTTLAAGNTQPIIGSSDIILMQAVVDPVGINRITSRMFSNAAAATAGMAKLELSPVQLKKPLIAATMFGVTTPSVESARAALEESGFEVLVFHTTGTGGKTMERFIRQGQFAGVLDVTLTELADELVGGFLSAGPDRLEAAGKSGIPQIVSLGALDMVNFGPRATVPEKFKRRKFYQHNELVTLMRTTAEECSELGRIIAQKLNIADAPVTLFVPQRGFSTISVHGQPFHDEEADQQLITAIKRNAGPDLKIIEIDTDINDPIFALAMAQELIELCAH